MKAGFVEQTVVLRSRTDMQANDISRGAQAF